MVMTLFIPRVLHNVGGSGMYIKNGIEYTILDKLTQCHKDVCESIFVELKHPNKIM